MVYDKNSTLNAIQEQKHFYYDIIHYRATIGSSSVMTNKFIRILWSQMLFGRIIIKIDENIYEMKFLHNTLEKFYWPSKDDCDEINKNIFFIV